MSDGDAFESALDDNPDDWNLRLIYADWLDDRGFQSLARAQRWMAEHKLMPSVGYDALLRSLGLRPAGGIGVCWEWWYGEHGTAGVGHDLFRQIPTPYSTAGPPEGRRDARDWLNYLEFETRRDAEAALALGLDRQVAGLPPRFADPEVRRIPTNYAGPDDLHQLDLT